MKFNFQGGAVLPRGLNFRRRGSAALPLLAILFFTVGATAETTNDLSDAEIQGRNFAQQLYVQRPAESFTNTGVLKILDKNGVNSQIPVSYEIVLTKTNWQSAYKTFLINDAQAIQPFTMETLEITHADNLPNVFLLGRDLLGRHYQTTLGTEIKSADFTMTPFANSDFWIADLGLEFFHWPEQKILKRENRRSRGCEVLESTNPNPSANGYSRVVSWIDEESGGIVHAEAYDFKNKLLKEFDPKSFKKVNGQWELQEMEIDNVQTGSRTRLEFTGFGITNSTGGAANPPEK
jgi:hypothetical protein